MIRLFHLATFVTFASFLAALAVQAQTGDRSKIVANSIGMEFRKSWSDSVGFGSSPVVRAAGL